VPLPSDARGGSLATGAHVGFWLACKMYSLYQRPAECSLRHRVATLQLFICTLQQLSTQLTTYVSGPIDNRRWRGLSIPQRFGCQGRPWLRHAHVGGRRKGTLILNVFVWGIVTPHFSVCDDARGVAWPMPHLLARMQNVQLALAASRVLHSGTGSRLLSLIVAAYSSLVRS